MTAAAAVPQEILDKIIEFLSDDPNALSASSLVGKAWLSPSRCHKFRSVRLSSLHRTGANTQLLCDPTSSVLPFICHLHIIEGRGRKSDPKWLDDALPRILPNAVKLTALESLQVEELTWENLSSESRACLRSIFVGLKDVKLLSPRFDSLPPALELISCASLLKHLKVQEMILDSDEVNLDDDLPFPPPLLTLDLDTHPSPILDWLRICSPKLKIKTLSLGSVSEEAVPFVSAFLKALGPILENLTILFYNAQPYSHMSEMAFCKEDSLVYNTSLRTLSLEDRFRAESTASSGAVQFRPVPSILRQVASPLIEEVSLTVFPSSESVNESLDMENLEELFTDGIFCKISTKLHVIAWSSDVYRLNKLRDSLFEALPSLYGQDRLEFSRGGGFSLDPTAPEEWDDVFG